MYPAQYVVTPGSALPSAGREESEATVVGQGHRRPELLIAFPFWISVVMRGRYTGHLTPNLGFAFFPLPPTLYVLGKT